jgi:hypothetical protein
MRVRGHVDFEFSKSGRGSPAARRGRSPGRLMNNGLMYTLPAGRCREQKLGRDFAAGSAARAAGRWRADSLPKLTGKRRIQHVNNRSRFVRPHLSLLLLLMSSGRGGLTAVRWQAVLYHAAGCFHASVAVFRTGYLTQGGRAGQNEGLIAGRPAGWPPGRPSELAGRSVTLALRGRPSGSTRLKTKGRYDALSVCALGGCGRVRNGLR